MAKDCLFTKLKGSVNASLPRLGELVIKSVNVDSTPDGKNRAIAIRNPEGFTVRVDGGGKFVYGTYISQEDIAANGVTEHTFEATLADKFIYLLTGEYNIYISDKYNIRRITLGYSSSSAVGFVIDDLEEFKYSSLLERFGAVLTPMTCDISGLKDNTLLEHLRVDDTDINGNINSLGKLTNLTILHVSMSKVVGSIEDFVSAQVSNGRNSVSASAPIDCNSILRNITFGGDTLQSSIYEFLTWSSASKITLFICSGNNISTATAIWAKGSTAAERAQFLVDYPGVTSESIKHWDDVD